MEEKRQISMQQFQIIYVGSPLLTEIECNSHSLMWTPHTDFLSKNKVSKERKNCNYTVEKPGKSQPGDQGQCQL